MQHRQYRQYRKIRGVHFVQVRGSYSERAAAHAAQMKAEIPDGTLSALARKNEWLIRRGAGLAQLPFVADFVISVYKNFLMPYLGTRLTDEEINSLDLVSKEINIPRKVLIETLFQADALMLLIRLSVMKHLLPEWIPGGLPGCSSAVALKDWTQSGRLLACRNFDYFVVGPWEKHPTVLFHEPAESDQIPFVSLSSAGIHTGGVTSMNREGLTLFTHAHFGRDVSLNGRPIVLIGDEVIRKSKTIGQAIDIIRKNPRCANWAFVLTSAKENESVVVEMTPNQIHVRGAEDGFLAHTNYFHNPKFRNREALLCGSYCEDLKGRFCQLRDQLIPHRGHLQPSHMTELMGNHMDRFSGVERVFGNTVSVVTTVQSAVFDPGAQKFWMACRNESPVGLGEYIEVDVDRLWRTPAEEYEKTMSVMPHYQPKNPALIEAVRHYRNAYQCYHTYNHEPDFQEKALEHIKKAIEVYPSDGHLWLQAGYVLFKMKKFEEAHFYLEKSKDCVLTDHVASVRDLYLARCLDLLGKRKEALQIYQSRSEVVEPKLRRAFRRGSRRTYQAWEIFQVQVDLQFPDTLLY